MLFLVQKWVNTLKYCKIHLLAAVWYMSARILEISDQNFKKNFAGCNGLTVVLARQWKVRFNLREEVSAPCFFSSSCIIYLWPQGKPNHWRQWLSNGRVCQDLPSVRWYCFCGQGGLEGYFQLHPSLSDSLHLSHVSMQIIFFAQTYLNLTNQIQTDCVLFYKWLTKSFVTLL